MSPILVRPVREQLEHDRLIRLLHTKFRRKHEAGMNPGNEQNAAVGTGTAALYPDLVLMSQERGHRLQTVVEVETGESVNHLEALAQWAHYARTRAAFHLYVPAKWSTARHPARTTRFTSPRSGVITSSETSRASRWFIAAASLSPLRRASSQRQWPRRQPRNLRPTR